MSPTLMQTWVRGAGGVWKRPGLPDVQDGEFPFGSVEPTAENVGAGILGAMPTTTITNGTGVSISGQVCTIAPGTIVESRVFPYFVNLGDGAHLINPVFTGPATEQATSRALVQGPSSGKAYVSWFTVDPQTPSSYYDGLGSANLEVSYGYIRDITDGFRVYNTLGGPVNYRMYACAVEALAQFMPDVANSRTITHNDGAQLQGTSYGSAPDDDVLMIGCSINARRSTTAGNATSGQPDNVAALMLTPNVGAIKLIFRTGWLSGGVATVNAGADNLAGSRLEITDTVFEKPGTSADSPSWALLLDASLTRVLSGNTYRSDGTAVGVTNG